MIHHPYNFQIVALYRNIIAHLYKFFYYILHLYEIAEPSTLVNGRDERASPAADKCVRPCLCGRQESESTRCFRPCIVCFSYICLYHIISSQEIWAPFGHQSFKIIVLLYTSMCKKVSISKVFYSLILFDSKKSNTIFYLR